MGLALLWFLGWHIDYNQAWRPGGTGKQCNIQNLRNAADVDDYIKMQGGPDVRAKVEYSR